MSVTFRGDKTSFPFSLKDGEVCIFCRSNVFNDSVRILLGTETGNSADVEYSQSCSNIHRAYVAGCSWCTLLANVVVFTAEYVNSMDADSDESDYEPNYVTLPMDMLDRGATLTVAISFAKLSNPLSFDVITAKVETRGFTSDHGRLPRLAGRDAIHLAFKVSAEDSPLFQRHWGHISAGCDDWLVAARRWLHACQGHINCGPASSFVPSRVLDVTIPSCPKFTPRAAIPFGKDSIYCTLSYVWGTAKSYTLTAQTKNQLLEDIDWKMLPRTIQDAIYVASRLKIKYLWVDALCILQDSHDDKAVELPQMANVYRCSALTISAASAEASSEGFTKPPKGLFYPESPPITLPLGVDGGKEVFLRLAAPMKGGGLERELIFKRAWTYQEQLLSHRNLLFKRDGVIWECLNQRVTHESTIPWSDGESFLQLCDASTSAKKQAIYERWILFE